MACSSSWSNRRRPHPNLAELAGRELIIDHDAGGYRFWNAGGPRRTSASGSVSASVDAARQGGTVVTCASASGYQHEYEDRYLWMNIERLVGSHFTHYREAREVNELIRRGLTPPTLSKTYPLDPVGQTALNVHRVGHTFWMPVAALA